MKAASHHNFTYDVVLRSSWVTKLMYGVKEKVKIVVYSGDVRMVIS
jgi:hypothetical protein